MNKLIIQGSFTLEITINKNALYKMTIFIVHLRKVTKIYVQKKFVSY